jgi:hypothetical protein
MNLRSDGQWAASAGSIGGPAQRSVFRRWLAVVAIAGLSGCGGGGGEPPVPQLAVQLSPTGLQALSNDVGGNVELKVLRALDGTLVQDQITVAPGATRFVVSNQALVPNGTSLELQVTRHPVNQLCRVIPSTVTMGEEVASRQLFCARTWLNDTGATACVNNADCALQDVGQGRDAAAVASALRRLGSTDSLTTGFDYTRICTNGEVAGTGQCPANPVPGKGATQWQCTRDNVTGLVWMIVDEPVGAKVYGEVSNWNKPTTAACGVQAASWRLPAANELMGLVHSGRSADEPAANVGFFPNLARGAAFDSGFWSSSSVNGSPLFVSFAQPGAISIPDQARALFGIWVSGASRSASYRGSTADATVSDEATGLSWAVCSLGRTPGANASVPCGGVARAYTWADALKAVADANRVSWGGHNDWRLPNRTELASLLDHSVRVDPIRISTDASLSILRQDTEDGTPETQGISYWTSTGFTATQKAEDGEVGGTFTSVFQVNFASGTVTPEPIVSNATAKQLRVRLVRDTR